MKNLFDSLSSPVRRLSRPNVPVPASPILEECLETTPDMIVAVARESIENSTY